MLLITFLKTELLQYHTMYTKKKFQALGAQGCSAPVPRLSTIKYT